MGFKGSYFSRKKNLSQQEVMEKKLGWLLSPFQLNFIRLVV